MNGINLRIFRRTNSNISFLFNNSALEGKKLEDLKIFNIEDKERKEPLVHVSALDQKSDTVQVVLDHQRNNLDANKTYIFVFCFGAYEVNIKVYPTEVLPSFEKDAAVKNQHLYGWCDLERKWVKLKAVKDADGEYVLAVKMVK